jgi:alkanesulfonate monooxygenase SsuD/methylene tetrahydromethanopterin reductase-like flavin-dependent oxidoreductase (luciferase family)
VGGSGKRTLGLVAKYADWWNVPVYALDRLEELRGQAGDARVSIQTVVALVTDEAERAEVTETAKRRFAGSPMGRNLVVGNADELAAYFAGLAAQRVERFYVWFADFAPVKTLAGFGEVIEQFD